MRDCYFIAKKMKGIVISLVLVLVMTLSIGISTFAAEEQWKTKPTITSAYESEKEKIYLEWEGDADIYQINVDGKSVDTVNIESATINLKSGNHQITVIPIEYISKDVDTKIDIGIAVFSGSIDLGAIGVDPKDLIQGTPSDVLKINYTVHPIVNAKPEITNAFTDFDGKVSLIFTDNFESDIYRVAIKKGNDVNYVEFNRNDEDAAKYIEKDNTTVSLTLDPDYLKKHECMIPELDQKYSFSIKLQKRPDNYISGMREDSSVLESQEGNYFEFTPYAAWKLAPEITYASQSDEGQVTLQWEHNDNNLGCEYKIVKIDKLLIVKSGETEIGRTNDKEYIIEDLTNGNYSFAVVPVYLQEEGFSSDEVSVEVKNDWVVAPSLDIEIEENNQFILKWTAPESIESYHVNVYTEGESLLKYINMDYKLYSEIDITAEAGNMEYTFTYDQPIDSEKGLKLKFEIYGLRHTTNGEEQQSAKTTQTIEIK